ncbi:tocopherol cyclase family protein [Bacteroidota bacterium]
MRIFRPEVFQGSLKKKNYFEGWYFKHVSHDLSQVYAFIPGISLSPDDTHAFIQVLNGRTGRSNYITYPLSQFSYKKNSLHVKIGTSIFTDSYIDLDINEPEIQVKGKLNYSGIAKYPKTILSPGIMGWYSYVPFMECYHGIVSADHLIEGALVINSDIVEFSNGKGYIEKDWGTSFPECWIWLHANSFSKEDASLFVSIAKIPWLGKFFIGFIAFLYMDGKYHMFTTYKRSRISPLIRKQNSLHIEFSNRDHRMLIEIDSRKSGELKAPQKGVMSRRIKESIDSHVIVTLIDNNDHIVYKDESERAGLEIIEEIFKYIT